MKLILVALMLSSTESHGYCKHAMNQNLVAQVRAILDADGKLEPVLIEPAILIMSEDNTIDPSIEVLPVCSQDIYKGGCS